MGKVLVTGANRGIGLELCKQLKSKGHEIYAVCRKASEPLRVVAKQIIEGVDVGRDQAVDQIQTQLQAEQLDIIINSAGILQREGLDHIDFSSIEQQIQVNAIGPLRVVKAVLSRLHKGAKIIMITSRMGSIEDNTSGGSYGYRMSKAALNAASKSLSVDLKERGIAVGIIHPGWVKTDMTGHTGNITPDESAEGIIQRIEELSMDNTGKFLHQNSEQLPW